MPNIFQDKDLGCVVIATSSSLRQLMSSVLRELGYAHVIAASDIKSCLEVMETERVGWIFGPLLDANGHSLLQLLDLVNRQPLLQGIKISVLRDDSDRLLPQAFAHGVMSCHRFPANREACFEELSHLVQQLHIVAGDFTRLSATYLKRFLLETKDHLELKRLVTSLLEIYPGDEDYLLDLAEAHLMAGDPGKAGEALLHQLLITAPGRSDQIKALCQLYLNRAQLPGNSQQLLAAYFGLESCLVVDPSSESLTRIERILQRLGFKDIICHSDPLQALKWLRGHNKPNLIICQWKLPNLPGPIFLYKLRHRLGLDIPLMVLHRNIEEREAPMLTELGANRLVQEPFTEKVLFEDIIWTLKQQSNPSEVQIVRAKLVLASKRRDVAEIRRLLAIFTRLPTLMPGDLLLMDAIIAFDSGCFLHAKKHALEAMKKGGDSRECMEILGKALMALREFEAAVRCLENVSFIAPFNVAHLCSLAECHLEQGNYDGFDEMIGRASTLDPDAQVVTETEAKGAINRGHTEMARKLMSQLSSFKEVLSFMNNRAVTLMRVGNFKEGLDLYHKTLASLPEGHSELRALVHYNLGLGYARANRLQDSVSALEEAEKTRSLSRQMKSKSLKTRIIAAVSSGSPLVINSEPLPSEQDEAAMLAQIRSIEEALQYSKNIKRSDYCLINVFKTEQCRDEVKTLLFKKMNFSPRGVLVKDFHKGLAQDDAS